MKRFVPREKLGKKARKQLDSEQRATWAFSPVSKKVESKKLYNRKRKSHDRYDDYGMGFLFVYTIMFSYYMACKLRYHLRGIEYYCNIGKYYRR